MEGEKQNNLVAQGAQVGEQVETPEIKAQTPQSVEELSTLVEKLNKEDTRKEGEIQRLQGLVKAAQKQGLPQAAVDKLNQRLGEMELSHATLADYLETHFGETETPQSPTKQSHVRALEEKRAAEKTSKEETPEFNPDQIKFIQYMISQGYDVSDPLIIEVTENGQRDPVEALKLLKGKVKEQSSTEVNQRIAEGIQEGLKKVGVVSGGVRDPSAPAGAWREKSAENKILQGVSAGQK